MECLPTKSESVREVKFNPNDKHLFAAGYETGLVEIFDIRNTD